MGYICSICAAASLDKVREHAAAVLAGLMKGGDENLAKDFRDRAYSDANAIRKKTKQRSNQSLASVHGAVLALVACVLYVPYDMPTSMRITEALRVQMEVQKKLHQQLEVMPYLETLNQELK